MTKTEKARLCLKGWHKLMCLVIAVVMAIGLVNCSDDNDIVGTKWLAKIGQDLDHVILEFKTEKSGLYTEVGGDGDKYTDNFSYTYNAPKGEMVITRYDDSGNDVMHRSFTINDKTLKLYNSYRELFTFTKQ